MQQQPPQIQIKQQQQQQPPQQVLNNAQQQQQKDKIKKQKKQIPPFQQIQQFQVPQFQFPQQLQFPQQQIPQQQIPLSQIPQEIHQQQIRQQQHHQQPKKKVAKADSKMQIPQFQQQAPQFQSMAQFQQQQMPQFQQQQMPQFQSMAQFQQQQMPQFQQQMPQFQQQMPLFLQQPQIRSFVSNQSANFCKNEEKPITIDANQNKKIELPKVQEFVNLITKAENPRIQLGQNAKTIKGIISIKTKDQQTNDQVQEGQRPGIDLICVIDQSGSMSGEKIDLVRQTLLQLLDLLTEQDRLSMILFESVGTCLNPLIPITKANIKKLQKLIQKISANGGTYMGSGTDIAFNIIKNRKYQNKIISVFVLGDGQDNEAKLVAQQQLKEYKIQDEGFTMHTFGFGNDHDPELMRDLAKLKDGNFYYIENLKSVDKCFLDALGGLVSLISQKAKLSCQIHPNLSAQFSDLRIKKMYGDWNFDEAKRIYSQNFNYLIAGKSKDYILEINVPPMKKPLTKEEKFQKVLKVELEIMSLDGQQYKFEKELTIEFCNQDEMINEEDTDQDIELNYIRVTGAETIEKANQLAQQNNFKEAQALLSQKINQLKASKYAKLDLVVVLLQDLEQVKKGCEQVNYANYGQKMMTNVQNVHMLQQSSQGVGYGPAQKQIYSTSVQQCFQSKRKN